MMTRIDVVAVTDKRAIRDADSPGPFVRLSINDVASVDLGVDDAFKIADMLRDKARAARDARYPATVSPEVSGQ